MASRPVRDPRRSSCAACGGLPRQVLPATNVSGVHPGVVFLPSPLILLPGFPRLIVSFHVRCYRERREEGNPQDDRTGGGRQARLTGNPASDGRVSSEDPTHNDECEESGDSARDPAHDRPRSIGGRISVAKRESVAGIGVPSAGGSALRSVTVRTVLRPGPDRRLPYGHSLL